MTWSEAPERGAGCLVTTMLWLLRHVRPLAAHVVLPGISAWFFLFSPRARHASAEFLTVALGRPVRARDILRHIHTFACTILDRAAALARPSDDAVALQVEGLEHVEAAAATGCILMGAHVGSFAVLRLLARRCPVPVRMLMHDGNAGPFTRAMAALDPGLARDIIRIGDVGSMLAAQAALAEGAMLGVLADRAPAGAARVVTPFFGRPAAFPTGPFVLAAVTGAPVLAFSAVRVGRGRYAVRFTPLTGRVVLRRAQRAADLQAAVSCYAAWLEALCRAHPFNWFNFYPFWEQPDHVETPARARSKPVPTLRGDLLGTAGPAAG